MPTTLKSITQPATNTTLLIKQEDTIESLSSSPNLNLVQSNIATHVRGGILDLIFVSSFLREHINTTIHQYLSSNHYALI